MVTMLRFFTALLIASGTLTSPSALAQETPVTGTLETEENSSSPPDPQIPDSVRKDILEKALSIQIDFSDKRRLHNRRALATVTEALRSDENAYQLYVDSIRAQYEESERPAYEFRDWRLDNVPLHRTKEFYAALKLQLLALRAHIIASLAKEIWEVMPAVHNMIDYYEEVEELIAYPRKLESKRGLQNAVRGMATRNCLSGPYADYLKLNLSLGGSFPFRVSTNPTQCDTVFSSIILPHFRKKKDLKQLLNTWDRRIRMQKHFAKTRKDRNDLDDFERRTKEQIPQLYWERTKDLYIYGDAIQSEKAAETMLSMVEQSLRNNPKVKGWLEELISLTTKYDLLEEESDDMTAGSLLGISGFTDEGDNAPPAPQETEEEEEIGSEP